MISYRIENVTYVDFTFPRSLIPKRKSDKEKRDEKRKQDNDAVLRKFNINPKPTGSTVPSTHP